MSETFRTTYPSTKCIRDCTKILCWKCSSLSSQNSLYLGYRHYFTRKGLFGIAPSVAICFNSKQALFQTKKFSEKNCFWAKIFARIIIQLCQIADSKLKKRLSYWTQNGTFLYSSLTKVGEKCSDRKSQHSLDKNIRRKNHSTD